MRLAYHPLAQRDVSKILKYYDRISRRLGDEFWSDLMELLALVSATPERFHLGERGLRRANMKRFPYHILFRSGAQHHSRHSGSA